MLATGTCLTSVVSVYYFKLAVLVLDVNPKFQSVELLQPLVEAKLANSKK